MTSARSNTSRSKEFDLIFGYINSPSRLLNYIHKNPNGGSPTIDGVTVEYGNVSRLIPFLEKGQVIKPFEIKPRYIGHIDHLSQDRKLEIERKYKLEAGSISSQKSKADLLIVDQSYRSYLLSFKDSESVTKLGQVSGEATYGKAKLKGGLENISLPQGLIPETFESSDTALTSKQFGKLNTQHQSFAYFKNNYPNQWEEIVKNKMTEAVIQLRNFGEVIEADQNSLIDFIRLTFAGDLKNLSNFYLLFGATSINFLTLLDRIKDANPVVEIQEYNTDNKISLIIKLKVKGVTYGLTKIEPSFDGVRMNVSQTKGIIYYFQQYPSSGNHFKKLFLDIAK